MLRSISRWLRLLSVLLAVVLVVASIAGASDAVLFLVELRRVVRFARLAWRTANMARACLPLFFA